MGYLQLTKKTGKNLWSTIAKCEQPIKITNCFAKNPCVGLIAGGCGGGDNFSIKNHFRVGIS